MPILLLLLTTLLTSCFSHTQSGPKSLSENSTARSQLKDRVSFIEQYVTFSRTYLKLEYDVEYHNNSGGIVPGPSDWDIKILAVVPADEIDEWIPSGATKTSKTPPSWVNTIPGSISTSNVTEWYNKGNSVVGIDSKTSTVVYRNATTPID